MAAVAQACGVGGDAQPGAAGCEGARRGLTGTHMEGDESQDGAQGEPLEIQPPVYGFHLPVLLRQPHQPAGTHGRVPTRVGCPPPALPSRRSPEPGVPLDGGAAGGRRVAAVEAEGGPAAVHQQLVAVRVVPDHPGEDADGHVLQPAGTQLGLLKVWGTRVPGSGWPVSLPGEGPDPTRSP